MTHPALRQLLFHTALGMTLVLGAVCGYAALDDGFPKAGSGTPQSAKTPEERAAAAYKVGLRYKKKARRYEQQAAKSSSDKTRDKLLAKAQSQYQKALKNQRRAFQLNHRLYRALNEMGYIYRRIGDYRKALGAYNAALRLKPDLMPAVEDRAEILMTLGFYEDTKQAYIYLFRRNADLAKQLMQAMQAWVEQHSDAADEKQQPFTDWVIKRSALLGQSLTLNDG